MDEYTAWLQDAIGGQVRYHLQLEPHVATNYVAAGIAVEAEPELADLPFADVADSDLAEAVTGIAPAGTDPDVAREINDLAGLLTDDEKALLGSLAPEDIEAALALAKDELDTSTDDASTDAAAPEADTASPADPGSEAEPELADLPFADVADSDLAEAVTGIAPAGTDPDVAREINDLAGLLTDDEKALLGSLTPADIEAALAQAKDELDAEAVSSSTP